MSWSEQRRDMVEQQLLRRGIHDARVLDAMARIPREDFVKEDDQTSSYSDCPISIGFGQTISQPYMTALMAQSLGLTGTETVLDVGTGSGYHAAVLGLLASRVFSIEVVPELAAQARRTLERTGLGANVTVLQGDGSLGFHQEAPYQGISVAAGAPDIPSALLDQLHDPGKLVIPVGTRADQDLKLVTKRGGRVTYDIVSQCRFVPLVGRQGWKI
ncbi:MAG: protein-L-isoaspartate O-methyltransferase [Bryobacteraceae bacterium]